MARPGARGPWFQVGPRAPIGWLFPNPIGWPCLAPKGWGWSLGRVKGPGGILTPKNGLGKLSFRHYFLLLEIKRAQPQLAKLSLQFQGARRGKFFGRVPWASWRGKQLGFWGRNLSIPFFVIGKGAGPPKFQLWGFPIGGKLGFPGLSKEKALQNEGALPLFWALWFPEAQAPGKGFHGGPWNIFGPGVKEGYLAPNSPLWGPTKFPSSWAGAHFIWLTAKRPLGAKGKKALPRGGQFGREGQFGPTGLFKTRRGIN